MIKMHMGEWIKQCKYARYHPGGLYLGWIEPSTALVSRRGRVVSAWGGNRTRMVVATTGPSCHLDYLVRTTKNILDANQINTLQMIF